MTTQFSADGFVNGSWESCDTDFFNLISPAEFTEPINEQLPWLISISLSDLDHWSKRRWYPPLEETPLNPHLFVPLDDIEVVVSTESDPPVVILQNPVDFQLPIRHSSLPTIVCRSMSFWWRGTITWMEQGAWGLLDEEHTVTTDDVPVFLAESMKIKMTSIDISDGPLFLETWVASNASANPW